MRVGSSDEGDQSQVGKIIRFYDWKFNFLKGNGMLRADLLAEDINSLCELIDKNSKDEFNPDK